MPTNFWRRGSLVTGSLLSRPTHRLSPASENLPGWVRMRPSPILTSLRKRERVPTAYLSFPQNPSAAILGRRGVSSITRKG